MTQADRSRIGIALVLILLGVLFLVVQLSPALQAWTFNRLTWPLSVVGVGALLLLVALATWTPALAIPACIVGGIGGLLYWQNATGNWESWAYAWTLIPGFVGVGIFLSALMQRDARRAVSAGGWLVLISIVMFLIFAAFLGGVEPLGAYWPALLIVLGLILLAGAFVGRGARA
jgi:hypothetical protein